jgi:hypothetical protein
LEKQQVSGLSGGQIEYQHFGSAPIGQRNHGFALEHERVPRIELLAIHLKLSVDKVDIRFTGGVDGQAGVLVAFDSESVKKLKTHHRGGGTEETQRKTPLPKVFSAKTLRLCDSVVGVSAFIHNL